MGKFYPGWAERIGELEDCIKRADSRTREAHSGDIDKDAEARFMKRAEDAINLAENIGPDWHGWRFWYVATEYKENPSQMAATWSPWEVDEAYYYLRLRYLREPVGGV